MHGRRVVCATKMFKMCVCVHAITRINYQVFTSIKHPLTLYTKTDWINFLLFIKHVTDNK